MKKKLFLLTTLLAVGLSSCVLYNGQGKPGASKDKTPAPTSSVQPISYSVEPVTPPAPHGGGESAPVVPPETSVLGVSERDNPAEGSACVQF